MKSIIIIATLALSNALPTFARDHLLGPTGILAQAAGTEFRIQRIETGSPVDGILKKGDIITGTDGKAFTKNARQEMAAAIDRAEATKGNLPLTLKEGRKVSLQLRPLGPYSETAPWDCKKTDAIITRVADQMLETKSFVGGQIPVGYIDWDASESRLRVRAVLNLIGTRATAITAA